MRDITDDPQQIDASATYLENLADPEKPLDAAAFISLFAGDRVPRRRLRTAAKIVGVVLLIVGLTLVWQFMPLSDLTDPANIEAAMASVSDNPWSAAIVLAAFVGGGLVAFPVNLLIAATAAAFGPLIGFAYAAAGTLVSALVTYGLGAWLGRAALQNIMGPRLNRIRKSIARKGVLSMATIRLVPLAPFTFVNMVAGASEIRLLDYVLGTAIGMAPGLVVMSALGHQLFVIFTDPSPRHFVLLAAALAIWVGLVIGLQAAVQRARRAHT